MNKKNKNEVMYEMKKKNPVVAVVLSLFIIGAGSMYSGKVASGFGQMALSIFLWFFLLGWIMWFISPFIAHYDASNHNKLLRLELDLE